MISSGIDALDTRLGGGLLEGRYYVLGGSPGAGKTTACMQFLIEGLDQGERCALLTQENPNDLLDQAKFLGYDFQAASESDQLAVVQYRLDFAHNYSRSANPELLARELIETFGTPGPRRLVIDTILPFADVGSGAHHAANALLHIMEHLSPTALFTVPGDVSDPYYTRLYDSVLSGAGGIFHLSMAQGGERELSLRKVRQGAADWQPLMMVLRPGVGLVTARDPSRDQRGSGDRRAQPRLEVAPSVSQAVTADTSTLDTSAAEADAEPGNGVIVIDPASKLPNDLAAALKDRYALSIMRTASDQNIEGDVGAIVVVLDAQEPEGAIAHVRQLRQAEVDQAVVMIVTGEGFRSSTRARALRAGADEVLEYDHAPSDVLDRIEIARQRGHHPVDGIRADVLLLQPTDENGTPLPVDEGELARAVQRHIDASEHPFFALALVKPSQGAHAQAWRALATELRLADGDLLAECSDGRLALYLHDISRKRALDLMSRIRGNHSTLRLSEETVYAYPLDAKLIRNWIQHASNPIAERASA